VIWLTREGYTGESRPAGVAYTSGSRLTGVAYTGEVPLWLNNTVEIQKNLKSA
jgi:hypothetical protein